MCASLIGALVSSATNPSTLQGAFRIVHVCRTVVLPAVMPKRIIYEAQAWSYFVYRSWASVHVTGYEVDKLEIFHWLTWTIQLVA